VLVEGLPGVLLFDLDDTILRFSAGQPNCWQLALERHLPDHADHPRLMAAIDGISTEFWAVGERAFWGRQNMLEARRSIARRALAAHGIVTHDCERIADHMTESKEACVRPFDGAIEALRLLGQRGHRLGLLTNGSSAFQRRKLSRFELEPLFELILIEGELGYGKPDRRVFQAALDHFEVEPRDTWMIGDNLDADIAGAQALGMLGVWHDAHGTGLPPASRVLPAKCIGRIAELVALCT
jgi:putative hydrolase of the HAD superfamily